MSQFTITRQCGHTETIQIQGPIAKREGTAKWEATRPCLACWKAEQAAAEPVKAAEIRAGMEDGIKAIEERMAADPTGGGKISPDQHAQMVAAIAATRSKIAAMRDRDVIKSAADNPRAEAQRLLRDSLTEIQAQGKAVAA